MNPIRLLDQMGSTYGRLEERGPLIAHAGFVDLCMEYKDLNDSLPPPLNVLLIPLDVYELGMYWYTLCTKHRQHGNKQHSSSEASGDKGQVHSVVNSCAEYSTKRMLYTAIYDSSTKRVLYSHLFTHLLIYYLLAYRCTTASSCCGHSSATVSPAGTNSIRGCTC